MEADRQLPSCGVPVGRRMVDIEGETLPGPVQSQDVRVRGRMLLFQKDRFRKDEKLDSDDDFKINLERESVSQGTSDGHP